MAFPSTPYTAIAIPADSRPEAIFHQYPSLPPERRDKIWTHRLEDTKRQIYRFTLRYPLRPRKFRTTSNDTRASDCLFLQVEPPSRTGKNAEQDYLQPLRESTHRRRSASKTCIESRKVVDMFPETIEFRHFPIDWEYLTSKP
ncbi:hypothetical protein V8E51_019435 [Hyaloscypha variabilis]